MSNYLIGVTGGIACYKTITLCRLLMKEGHDVKVIMTDNACKFITPLTFETITRNRAYVGEFDPGMDPGMIEHIDLAGWADEFLIVPATANCMAKIAHGIADDLLTSTALVYKEPIIFAPSMNVDMLADITTQKNMQTLIDNGNEIIECGEGEMACKAEGKGRVAEPEEIMEYLFSGKGLNGLKVLVTAGPTVEPIDPVRYITNRSSGKMGVAIAKTAKQLGADVKVIAGPVSVSTDGLDVTPVQTAEEMMNAVKGELESTDILIMAAAVADYRPADYSDRKIKKSDDEMTLTLEKNPDILKAVSSDKKGGQVFVGFAAESNDIRENALKKLESKKLDFIVANDISRADIGFETDENEVTMFFADGRSVESGKIFKSDVAKILLDNALQLYREKNGLV